MKQLTDYLTESFNKEYGYRVKIAADCGAEHLTKLENCLQKYNLVSATKWKRAPIQENPAEFVRHKGAQFTSEVCSSDVILKYPVNERILEVWLAVHMGLDHSRVLVYGVKEPRRLEADNTAERTAHNKDRTVTEKDAVLNKEDQTHYEMQNEDVDQTGALFGEEFNKRFLEELKKIKAEKGDKYFSNYPTKDQIMGEDLRAMWDNITGVPNMGRGTETTKEVDVVSQSSRRN
jgi:hypothetical protein